MLTVDSSVTKYHWAFWNSVRLIADAGALLVTVQAAKQTGTHRTVVIDGGMNTLLRPALYDAYHRFLPFREANDNATPILRMWPSLSANRQITLHGIAVC